MKSIALINLFWNLYCNVTLNCVGKSSHVRNELAMDKNQIHNSAADLTAVQGTYTLLSVQICFKFVQFLAKKMAKNKSAAPPLDWHRPLQNPGTATVILSLHK